MSVASIFTWLGTNAWLLLKDWLFAIFVAPFNNFDMLWVLVPIYLGWITADFFQEKHGTSLGNAITNGIIPLWAGIDWTRTTLNYLTKEHVAMAPLDAGSRFLLAGCVIAYGVWIIYDGLKAKKVTKYIGRVRTVSYVVILLTPVFYNAMSLSFTHILATLLFFPIFYYVIELVDQLTPDPRSITEEEI